MSGKVQVIKIVFVDNKNLNKIIHLSANSLQKSRYSNEAEATFSTLAKVNNNKTCQLNLEYENGKHFLIANCIFFHFGKWDFMAIFYHIKSC